VDTATALGGTRRLGKPTLTGLSRSPLRSRRLRTSEGSPSGDAFRVAHEVCQPQGRPVSYRRGNARPEERHCPDHLQHHCNSGSHHYHQLRAYGFVNDRRSGGLTMKSMNATWTCPSCREEFAGTPPEHRLCGDCLGHLESAGYQPAPGAPYGDLPPCPDCGGEMAEVVRVRDVI